MISFRNAAAAVSELARHASSSRTAGIAVRLFPILVSAAFATPALSQNSTDLSSPNGRIAVRIRTPEAGSAAAPTWTAAFMGRPTVSGRLGLEAAGEGDLLSGVRASTVRRASVNQRIPVLYGKADHADNHYNEVRFAFENPKRRRIEVTFRCYDDALALRYDVPRQPGMKAITVTEETTSFLPAGDPTSYVQYLENYRTSHEHAVTTVPLSEIKSDTLLDMPATFSWPNGTYLAITEAALRRYAGMSLMRSAGTSADTALVCRLTPRPDGTKVMRELPMRTPWRVAMIADRPGGLLESNSLYCLNEPSAIRDTVRRHASVHEAASRAPSH